TPAPTPEATSTPAPTPEPTHRPARTVRPPAPSQPAGSGGASTPASSPTSGAATPAPTEPPTPAPPEPNPARTPQTALLNGLAVIPDRIASFGQDREVLAAEMLVGLSLS